MESIYFWIIIFVIDTVGFAFWKSLFKRPTNIWHRLIPFAWIFS